MYHNSSSTVAAVRTQPEGPRRIDVEAFAQAIQTMARMLSLSTPRKSEADRQFLADVMRGETRFPFRSFERLAVLASSSERKEHREAFAEIVRKFSLATCDRPANLLSASDAETEANGPFDVAMRAFEHTPTLATKTRAIETGRTQLLTTRELLDVVEATPVYQ